MAPVIHPDIQAEPNSRLTLMRPDIWRRGLSLATSLTGYEYAPKVSLPDGTVFACGWAPPVAPPTKKQKEESRRREIEYWREVIERVQKAPADYAKPKAYIKEIEDRIRNLESEIGRLAAPRVLVPEGAMEWLLHEVGHWVAATPAERALPDYGIPIDTAYDDKAQIKTSGFGYEREWQAWAFEEIVMAPFGPARTFCPPIHRGGIGFSKASIPHSALTHIESRIRHQNIAVEEWRKVIGEWIEWGRSLGAEAPWSE